MTLIHYDSFETSGTYPKNSPGCSWASQNTTNLVSRTGTFCLRFSSGTPQILMLPAAAKYTFGFAYWMDSFANNTAPISVFGDAGVTQHLTLTIESTGVINLRRGNQSGTIIATATPLWPGTGQWRSIQFQATISDTVGTCKVRLDDVEVINFTGDTKNGGTNSTIDKVQLLISGGLSNADDFWVCDGVDATATQGVPNNDFLGDLSVAPLRPSGNGTYSQLLGSDGNSTDNYLLVDEVGPNTTDYVGSATTGQHDLYVMQDLPTATSAVIAVQPVLVAQKSDAGTANLKPMIKENSVETLDTAVALSTSWATMAGAIRCKKPSAGTAWTAADVNGMEAGMEVA